MVTLEQLRPLLYFTIGRRHQVIQVQPQSPRPPKSASRHPSQAPGSSPLLPQTQESRTPVPLARGTGPLALASWRGRGAPASHLALVPGLGTVVGQAQGLDAGPQHSGPGQLQQHEVMLIRPPGQDGARALLVSGVHHRDGGPAKLLALEKQEVVISNASPQRPGEGRVVGRQSLCGAWDWTLSPWEGGSGSGVG